MAAENRYDVLIIGGGQAGIPLAHGLAKAGKRVGLAERQHLGGSCVNFGCTPTKAVIASARVAQQARRATEFGLKIPTVEVDFPAVLSRARRIVMEFRNGLQQGLERSDNPKLLRGHARFESRDAEAFRLHIGDQVVAARQVVLDTGTSSLFPPIEGLSGMDFIDAENWLEKPEADERLATNVDGVWVAGNIRGGPMFTHTAWDDYRVLMSQMTGDGSRTTDRVVPYAIFTDPELGRAGMTESEARQAGGEIKVARFEMKKNGKAKEIGEIEGFIKIIADRGTNRILGAAVLAAEDAELVHMYVDLMNANAPYSVIRDAVHLHPTLAEAVQSAVPSID